MPYATVGIILSKKLVMGLLGMFGELSINRLVNLYCISSTANSLSRMNHPNIVKLKEVIRENDNMYFVFEYMNLISEIGAFKSFKAFFTCMSMDTFTVILSQVIDYQSVSTHVHRFKYTLYRICLDTLLRYRAPEVLLQSYVYTSKVDMWAMGATLAELLSLCPLFPGARYFEAIYKVCNVIGSPTQETWLEGLNLASVINYQFPQRRLTLLSGYAHGIPTIGRLLQRLYSTRSFRVVTMFHHLSVPKRLLGREGLSSVSSSNQSRGYRRL
ncbi:BnaA02g23960D [Brassica napus]|uniref:BnaA02g23960D protein n=1 Tax=Brassica napus TaxID=3708 RepID=A0A078GMC0_BRANA|nr:BnaA02g23960D [Brassica napus]